MARTDPIDISSVSFNVQNLVKDIDSKTRWSDTAFDRCPESGSIDWKSAILTEFKT